MTRTCYILMVLALAFSMGAAAFADETGTSTIAVPAQQPAGDSRLEQLGVGVQLGTFSGLTFEYWYGSHATVDTSLTVTRGNTAANLSHVWMFRDAFTGDWHALAPFVGVGLLGVWANSSQDPSNFNYRDARFALSLQVPVGVEYLRPGQRYSVYAEVSPSYEVVPARLGFLVYDVGARLYF